MDEFPTEWRHGQSWNQLVSDCERWVVCVHPWPRHSHLQTGLTTSPLAYLLHLLAYAYTFWLSSGLRAKHTWTSPLTHWITPGLVNSLGLVNWLTDTDYWLADWCTFQQTLWLLMVVYKKFILSTFSLPQMFVSWFEISVVEIWFHCICLPSIYDWNLLVEMPA